MAGRGTERWSGVLENSESRSVPFRARPQIALLDHATANRIAAGEVVERPASAVKELVENAIDSGARRVAVEIDEGGKRRIEVVDDGCGMVAEEAVLALQRHATSKIRTADDLFDIRSLGFRGEALPSIASVSRMTLISRPHDEEVGACLHILGGAIESVEEAAAPGGTRIRVEELFFNTPARHRFMKSTPTEAARALEAVGQLAFAHPSVALVVRSGPLEALNAPGNGAQADALAAIWGRDMTRGLLLISGEPGPIEVSGLICPPAVTRPGRSHEMFIVNGRPVRSRVLSHAVEEAMRTLTPEGRYPAAAIQIRVPNHLVDVNVHPTKAEVKFARDGDVHHAVGEAVRRTLREQGLLPRLGSGAAFPAAGPSAPIFVHDRQAPAYGAWPSGGGPPPPAPGLFEALRPPDAAGERTYVEQLRGFRVLGQARLTYIVAATDDGLAMIDQHVAHERVLYERLRSSREQGPMVAQILSEPISLSLGPAEAALVGRALEDLAAAGWVLEPFGRDAFLVRGAPASAPVRQCEALLRDTIDEIVHQSISRRLLIDRDRILITAACKLAVKSGDPLSLEEMAGLVEQLCGARNPSVCPHGRPAVVVVPYGEVDRRFGR